MSDEPEQKQGSVGAYCELEASHYFSWRLCSSPFTTDPRYAKSLTYGKHQRVTVNGEDAGKVVACLTGLNGWVDRLVEVDGVVQLNDSQDEELIERVFGNVVYSIINRRVVVDTTTYHNEKFRTHAHIVKT